MIKFDVTTDAYMIQYEMNLDKDSSPEVYHLPQKYIKGFDELFTHTNVLYFGFYDDDLTLDYTYFVISSYKRNDQVIGITLDRLVGMNYPTDDLIDILYLCSTTKVLDYLLKMNSFLNVGSIISLEVGCYNYYGILHSYLVIGDPRLNYPHHYSRKLSEVELLLAVAKHINLRLSKDFTIIFIPSIYPNSDDSYRLDDRFYNGPLIKIMKNIKIIHKGCKAPFMLLDGKFSPTIEMNPNILKSLKESIKQPFNQAISLTFEQRSK